MSIKDNLVTIKSSIPTDVTLVVVTKTHPLEKLMEVYNANHKIFGENKVQDLCYKYESLPKDIEWHMIGHLQTNKVKFIVPFVSLIHSIDSLKLLKEVNKQAFKLNKTIKCLLQIHIAEEESKFGFSAQEVDELFNSNDFSTLQNIKIVGLMGMATNTDSQTQIKKEFNSLKIKFDVLKEYKTENISLKILSMGMSSDYQTAIECGSNMVRIGSSIFGKRL